MQTIEAVFSLAFFVLIISAMDCVEDKEKELDSSLYRVQLAGDVWRVLYLKGAFDNLEYLGCSSSDSCEHVKKTEEMTGMRIYIGGTRFSGPGGVHPEKEYIRMKRILIVGSTAKNVSFTLKR